MTIARAVMVHTTMVSRKTSIGPQTPCSDGVSTLAGEWTMAAVPKPASLEYMPLATPIFMVTKIEPMIPPVAAEGLNAALMIVPIAEGTCPIFRMMMNRPASRYAPPMNGAITAQT